MAGITNGKFCKSLANKGFDMVTMGGYSVDEPTIQAARYIQDRGRSEFVIEELELLSFLKKEVSIIKESGWSGKVSINIRSTTTQPIINISKIQGVDVVEINAHCRQPEILDVGSGQALLDEPGRLQKFISRVVEDSKAQVSVKIRANVPGVDDIKISRVVEAAGADYLHVDAMMPGLNTADYNVISSIKKNTSIYLIGNNSVKDIDSARKMLSAGADGISIARAIMDGNLNFDLSQI
jgi:TIM-barrel protein